MPAASLHRGNTDLANGFRRTALAAFCLFLLMLAFSYAVHGAGEGFPFPEREQQRAVCDQKQLSEEKSAIESRHQESLKQYEILQQKTGNRLTALYKFRQLRYAFPLLLLDSGGDTTQAAYFAHEILECDHRLLLRLRESGEEARRAKAALARRQDQEKKSEEQPDSSGEKNPRSQEEEASVPRLSTFEADNPADIQQVRLEETQRSLERKAFSRKPIFIFGEQPFAAQQGRLPLPTDGEIVDSFAARSRVSSNFVLYNRGILVQAPKGQPVHAVHDGIVVFADAFKEYGNVIILDHGDHYHSLMAHAERLLKKAGDVVKGGETVATVGDTGAAEGAGLYFEIRHFGKAVDPMEWVAVQKSSNE